MHVTDHEYSNWLWHTEPTDEVDQQVPAVQAPRGQVPAVQVSGVQVPAVEVSGVQVPAVQAPGDQVPAVVFDMDGVISNAEHRQHYLNGGRRDWDGFFAACGDDEVIEDTAVLLDLLGAEHRIVLLTARPTEVCEQTLEWLQRNALRWDVLIMRDYGDYRASSSFKSATVEQMKGRGMDLRLAFEDDRRNVEMFRAHDVPCIYIHSGYYD